MTMDNKLVEVLFKYGLGEHLILHVREDKPILGKLVYDKTLLVLKDHEMLSGINPAFLKPCWDNGMLGMICKPKRKEWESLSFYGLDKCNHNNVLTSARNATLSSAKNQYGDKLIDFVGSIYRGFSLMLENNLLPVILLQQISSKSGDIGLAVTDLRTATITNPTLQVVHDVIRESVDKRLSLNVEDTDMTATDFRSIFKQFL